MIKEDSYMGFPIIIYGTDADGQKFGRLEMTDQPTRDTIVWTTLDATETGGRIVERIYCPFGEHTEEQLQLAAETEPPENSFLIYSQSPPFHSRGQRPDSDPHDGPPKRRGVDKKADDTDDQRLKRLGILTANDPHVVFINRDGDHYNVVEHFPSARRKPYKQYTLASPDDYVRSGNEVVIIDDLED